jgi:hypothetical protein
VQAGDREADARDFDEVTESVWGSSGSGLA